MGGPAPAPAALGTVELAAVKGAAGVHGRAGGGGGGSGTGRAVGMQWERSTRELT